MVRLGRAGFGGPLRPGAVNVVIGNAGARPRPWCNEEEGSVGKAGFVDEPANRPGPSQTRPTPTIRQILEESARRIEKKKGEPQE